MANYYTIERTIKTINGTIYSISNFKRSFFRKSKNDTAIFCLHGGPGYPHNYMLNFFDMNFPYPVVLYDQSACGKSKNDLKLENANIDYFVEELSMIINEYGYRNLILYGHSWGSILALEYYVKYPGLVKAIIFSSSCLSISNWIKDSHIYISQLSEISKNAILTANSTYNYSSKEYLDAVEEFYRICVFYDRPKPELLNYCDLNSNPIIYGKIWGINEFTVTGTIKTYDGISKLKSVSIPTYFISGEFDECLPSTTKYYASQTRSNYYYIVPNSRHFMNIENFIDFKKGMNNFLTKL